MKHVPLCSCAGLGVLSLPDPESWTKQIQQVSHQSNSNVNPSFYGPPRAKKLRNNWMRNGGGQEAGVSACLTHFCGCGEAWLWWWNLGQISERCCSSLQLSLPLLCSPGQEKPLTTSRAAHVSNWFLHNFEGDWRCSASCQRAHWEDESQKKPEPTSPLLLVWKSWCLLPLKQNSRKAGIGSSFPLGIQETD